MKLSELKTHEKGVIVKVAGHGGFRKRIIEMGFIKGKEVEVLLNAPLQDPVKYKIMGYEVSLRHNEAEKIEVVRYDDLTDLPTSNTQQPTISTQQSEPRSLYTTPDTQPFGEVEKTFQHSSFKTINVALVGNPNCGKTSLFNCERLA